MSVLTLRWLLRPAALLAVAAMVLAAVPPAAADSGAGDERSLGRPEVPRDALAQRLKAPRTGALAWQGNDVVAGAVLVTVRTEAAAERLIRERGATRLAARVVSLETSVGTEFDVARDLAGDPDVVAAEPDRVHRWQAEPNDPLYGQQWAHQLANVERAWETTTGDPGVKVAVLDSGMDATHPDLTDNVVAQVDVSSGSAQQRTVPTNNATCTSGVGAIHGTYVGGVIGAVGDNGEGVAGVAWDVGLIDVSLVSPTHGGCQGPSDSQVIAGLDYVASEHSDAVAVNLSLGRAEAACPSAMQRAIDDVMANGTAVIAASGNEGNYYRLQPAGCRGVIAVGAVGADGQLAVYSGKNRYLDLVAPGGDSGISSCTASTCVATTAPGGGYDATEGTSFAAPYVSGVAALLHSVRPGLSPWEVESILEQTARHPEGNGVHDERFGWGLVDAGSAVAFAASSATVPPLRDHPLGRWATGDARTEPITQAVAVSQRLFAGEGALHAVIARSDDFADALAGSSLAFGVGPLLFTQRTGSLATATRRELERVLPSGGTVYLLGGDEALDPALDAELAQLGYQVRRLEGETREFTAVEVARELERFLGRFNIPLWPEALIATRGNWPDAVAAGSFGALFGAPILLTPRSGLHPATRDYLVEQRGAFDAVLGIGGPVVVSDDAILEARDAAQAVGAVRLGGETRDETAVEVARAVVELLESFGGQLPPPSFAITVNLDRSDAYAHTLSASAIAGASASPFVPVRQAGDTGRVRVPEPAAEWACNRGYDLLLAGDVDLLPDGIADELAALLEGRDSRC